MASTARVMATKHPIVADDLDRLAAEPLPWETLRGGTILVTGGAGLVASYLVEAVLRKNEEWRQQRARVIVTVRNADAARARFGAYADRTDLEIIEHDAALPPPELGPIRFLVHAAGQAAPTLFGRDPVGTYAPNVLGTHHLLERAARDRTSGVLFLSSGAVHGALGPEVSSVREEVYGVVDPLDPRSSYAESKRMGETICRSWFVQHRVPVRMARLGHTYGPGMRRSDERAFAQFVFDVLDGRDIVLNSDGSAQRPYCYLRDATSALLRLLLAGEDGEAYLVANPDAACSIRELAELIAGLDPGGRATVRHASGPPAASYVPNRDPFRPVDISKIRALGWEPTTGLREGFTRTLESYR
jgi:UDP-glucuronate decarboxylase